MNEVIRVWGQVCHVISFYLHGEGAASFQPGNKEESGCLEGRFVLSPNLPSSERGSPETVGAPLRGAG